MTYEQFIERVNEVEDQIAQLTQEKESIIDSYIEANAEFKVGDKVKVGEGEDAQYGFVDYIKIKFFEYNVDFLYLLKKMKKDGTPSNHTMYYWNAEISKA